MAWVVTSKTKFARLQENSFWAKRLYVKLDRGFGIGKCFFVSIAFSDYDAFQAQWIGNVAVEVLLDVSSQKVGALCQAAPSWNRRRWKINPALALPEAGALS